MTEKQQLNVNLGCVITFGLFLFLSFVTAEADSTQRVMVRISEIIGGVAFISAILSLIYIKNDQRYVPVAILIFLMPWLLYAIGYELTFDATTNYSWIWFISLYLILMAGFIFLRSCYRKLEGVYKLLPVFLIFINAILFVFLVFIHIWWSMPFAG